MMMTDRRRNSSCLISAVLSFVFVFLMACENVGDEAQAVFNDQEKSAYEDEESAERYFDLIESITNSAIQLAESNTGGRISESADPELTCAQVSFEGGRQTGRIEINFGDGCEGPDGKVRKGIIVVEYEGHWLVAGAKVYTLLKGFSVDDIKVEGTRILTNTSVDLKSLKYTVEIIGGKIIWPGEGEQEYILTRESERQHTLVFGDGLDDFQLHVEGVASGMTRGGRSYSSKIDQPLIFKSSCRGNTIYMPTSGSKTIMLDKELTIRVDYGTGECDNKIIIRIGEQDKEVEI